VHVSGNSCCCSKDSTVIASSKSGNNFDSSGSSTSRRAATVSGPMSCAWCPRGTPACTYNEYEHITKQVITVCNYTKWLFCYSTTISMLLLSAPLCAATWWFECAVILISMYLDHVLRCTLA
jgi:hypothetical protein